LSDKDLHFSIRASASRLDKGLLAIPQRFRNLFPDERTQIHVVFDDGQNVKSLTFQPYDSVVKENRIFGLRRWFLKRGVQAGDLISITAENREKKLYRIALDRFMQERQEQKVRRGLKVAKTDTEAEQHLVTLSRLTRRRPREVAREELFRMAEQSASPPRPTIIPQITERREVVPSGVRILLREVHNGKCQLCSFTFEKRNGEYYFEVHHLNPKIGHHPRNLLVVCPNCHAQLEHATVTDPCWTSGWLAAVTINGKQISVRQPLLNESHWKAFLGLMIVVAALRVGRFLVR
jgi:hypothetical protein